MLEGEVLKNIDTEGFELVNIDDKSCAEEVAKGKSICKDHDMVFLENKSRGVQMATQTLVDFINKERPQCKWILCFQHDIWPVSKGFFSRISKLIKDGKLDAFGSIGFNIVDGGEYTKDSWARLQRGEEPIGMVGFCHLGVSDNSERWLAVGRNPLVDESPELFKTPFICEYPQWPAVGINVEKWNKVIKPTEDYEFHLWYPDVAMQFNFHNCPVLILPKLYCFNHQKLKEKYGLHHNSAIGAMKGDTLHFGSYGPHFENWKKRWGWDYENVFATFPPHESKYKDTLIGKYFHHQLTDGPLETFNLGDY